MPRVKKRGFETLQELTELQEQFGVSADRIQVDPLPGQATVRDLLRLIDRRGRLYEMVDRTLVEKPMGSPEAYIATELSRRMGNFLDGNDFGYLYGADGLIELIPGLVRGPDVCFTPWTARPERTVPRKPVSKEIPALAAEVLSRKNTVAEIERKLKEYFLAGVRLVWVIDPRTETAVAYTASDAAVPVPAAGVLDGADVLPGFRLPLAKLFERLEKPKPARRRKK